MKRIALLLAAILAAWCVYLEKPATQTAVCDSAAMLRLHVVAESDKSADQDQKLLVRDAVLKVLHDDMQRVQSQKEAKAVVQSLLPEICTAAECALEKDGKDAPVVTARIQTERFPSIAYNGRIVPAGEYLALRVVIGEGKGRNWWCVLFPPLCYADVHYDGKEDAAGSDEIEIRWFVQEIFKNRKKKES